MQKTVRSIDEALKTAASAVENGGRVAVQTEKGWLRAAIQTAGVVLEDGHLIVPVVFATETPVRRYNWRYNDYEGEYFDEVLSMDSAHCDLERANSGAPVLDSHDQHGSVREVVLGVVIEGSAVLSGTEAHARLKMSARPELASLISDIRAGIVKNISVGYDVDEFTREESVNTNLVPIYRATKWTPKEVSFVPIPADYNSGVRGAETSPPKNLITIPMKYGIRAQRDPGTGAAEPSAAAPVVTPAAAPPATPVAAPAPAPAAAPAPATDPALAERSRAASIRAAVSAFRLPTTLADTLVAEGVSVAAARERIQTEFAGQDPTTPINGTNGGASVNGRAQDTQLENFARAAAAGVAIRARSAVQLTAEERAAGETVRGMSLLRMAEQVLTLQGVSTSNMSARELAQKALRAQGRAATGMLTTSDLPMILQSVAIRTLRAEYAASPSTFEAWSTPGVLNDFRTAHRVAISGLLKDFAKVAEGGEYTYNTVSETGESIRLGKYGTIMPISWEAIQNDDLDVFSRLPRGMARKSKTLQGNLVYGVLLANPVMGDGHKLFSAEHNNMATVGSAVSTTSIGAAVKSFRTQKAYGEETEQLNLRPKYIICGPDIEQDVLLFLSKDYIPTKASDVNIYRGQFEIIVDARIQGKGWYLATDPREMETVEYAFLAGEPELFTEEQWNFNRDSYEIKGRTVMGVAPLDFRGLYWNPGPA